MREDAPSEYGRNTSCGRLLGFCAVAVATLALIVSSVVSAQPVYPTVTLTLHRIQMVDPIEGAFDGQADWFFHIGHRASGTSAFTWIGPISAPVGFDDVTIDDIQTFEVRAGTVEIVIELCEDDVTTADDYADVSSDSFEGADNVDCLTRPSPGWYGGSFHTTYNLVSDSMSGDAVTSELGWWKTSGEFDSSTGGDTNDANVFFRISDNYSPPTSNAGPDKSALTGESISFDGTGSLASAGSSIELYSWDFTGDLSPDLTGPIVSWTFNTKGTHTVTLTIRDSIGNTDTDTATVVIVNRAPVAAFAFSPTNPTVRDEVSFASTSTDPDGTIASWAWNFGDGATSTLPNPTHRYSTNGPKTVGLTVTDSDGATATVTQTVNVANLNPVSSFTFSPTVVTTADIVQFTDTSTDEDGSIAAWSWDFGDGSSSDTRNPTHNFGSPGTYEVALTVTDDNGGTHLASQAIVVSAGIPGGTLGGVPVLVWGVILVAAVALIATVVVLRLRKRKLGPGPPVAPPQAPPG